MLDIIAAKKETIKSFFEYSRQNPFLIPEYQRPYEWETPEVVELFNDLRAFNEDEIAALKNDPEQTESRYFLGSIVYFVNDRKQREIVDGQQRIISIFLLFRSICERLKTKPRSEVYKHFLEEIEEIIWQTNKFNGKVDDPKKVLITSEAISDTEHEIFTTILATGEADPLATDFYSRNYLTMRDLIDDLNDEIFTNFVYRLLNCVILLPIEASTFSATLEIFERLNDRGKQLTDADILKSKIYTSINTDNRKRFVTRWKMLDERAQIVGESMHNLFMYYIYYVRAKNKDIRVLEKINLRKYFLDRNSEALRDENLMTHLEKILSILLVMKSRQIIDGASWSRNFEIRKCLDIIWRAPSEWWRYPAIVYYIANSNQENFDHLFLIFLHKLIATLSRRYVIDNSTNSIKKPIVNTNIRAIGSVHPTFNYRQIDEQKLLKNLRVPRNAIIPTLLRMIAYEDMSQLTLLPSVWETDHVYPEAVDKNQSGSTLIDQVMQDKIKEIGNLIPFEKKLKIPASPDYFAKKRAVYKNSKIAMTKKFSDLSKWEPKDISIRTEMLVQTLLNIWQRWDEEYESEGK